MSHKITSLMAQLFSTNQLPLQKFKTNISTFLDLLIIKHKNDSKHETKVQTLETDQKYDLIKTEAEQTSNSNNCNINDIKDNMNENCNQKISELESDHMMNKYSITSEMIENINIFKPIQLIFLLTTGSLNPIHCGHTDMMVSAKHFFDCQRAQSNQIVIGGYLSPSHDSYVKQKFKRTKNWIPDIFRLTMVYNATKNSQWLDYCSYEMYASSFIDFPAVLHFVQNSLEKKIEQYLSTSVMKAKTNELNLFLNKGIKKELHFEICLYYVCGMDHALKCGLLRGMNFGNICVIARPGYELKEDSQSKNSFDIIVCESYAVKDNDRSSTMVRNIIRKEDWSKLHGLVHDCNIKYMMQNEVLQKLREYLL